MRRLLIVLFGSLLVVLFGSFGVVGALGLAPAVPLEPQIQGTTKLARADPNSRFAGTWRLAAGDPFTHTLITLDAAAVLGDDLVPEGALETARSYLEGLGAHALLARLAPASART